MIGRFLGARVDKPAHVYYQRQDVMECSLHVLIILWFFSWVVARGSDVLREYLPWLVDASLTPVILVFTTIIWVVVSRVVSTGTRMALFMVWVATFLLTVLWSASPSRLGDAAEFGSATLLAVFLVLLLATRFMSMRGLFKTRTLYLFLVLGTAAASLFAWNRMTDILFLAVSGTLVMYAGMQVWTTYNYARYNNDSRIHNTCSFAVMSPWTDVIDAFAAISHAFDDSPKVRAESG